MTPDPDRILGEFVDAWNAGRRPDVDEYLARAGDADREQLAADLVAFLAFAPTPEYDDAALAAIRSEPVVAGVAGAAREQRRPQPAAPLRRGRGVRDGGLGADRGERRGVVLGRRSEREEGGDVRGELVAPAGLDAREVLVGVGAPAGVPRVDEVAEDAVRIGGHGGSSPVP